MTRMVSSHASRILHFLIAIIPLSDQELAVLSPEFIIRFGGPQGGAVVPHELVGSKQKVLIHVKQATQTNSNKREDQKPNRSGRT